MHAVAALLTGKGVDHQVRGADQTVLLRGGRVDREQCLHQRGIEPTAKLGEHFWQHNMLLDSIHLDLGDPAGIHHRPVGPHPATALLIGAGPLMCEEFQR